MVLGMWRGYGRYGKILGDNHGLYLAPGSDESLDASKHDKMDEEEEKKLEEQIRALENMEIVYLTNF